MNDLASVAPFVSATTKPGRLDRILPDRLLGHLTLALLAVLVVALLRGRPHWGQLPLAVWLHLATIMPAMALTPVILAGRKGDRRHRRLGYVWVALLAATALISFAIRAVNGGFSPIHALSAWTLVMLVLIVQAARAHEPLRHRARVRGLVFGSLLIAGLFTLPFGRMLGVWLTGG